ncbi:MAG: hypothetical protein CME62_02795 [Halobacteriovoraceae bacterium]|nr:hypothetical protein [Halobacteriovoraceae bacterium]|tara:strand:+ start:10412 stop:11050 length:639 start_codon:yes stop_codon:yes gene_type:complete
MDDTTSSYVMEEARNGALVPKIDGTYLHSIYNPQKEAEQYVEKNENQLKRKQTYLILGLGFGYHIDAILEFVKKNHTEFNIVVLEPNKEIISEYVAQKVSQSSEIKIVYLDTVEKLYTDKNFVDFLRTKPCVLKHDQSYTIYNELFNKFLTFKSSDSEEVFESTISDLTRSLFNLNNKQSYESAESIKKQKRMNGREDFLMMAFSHIANTGK